MTFDDAAVFPELRFSFGVEAESGRFYLSIPVSDALVDYEEYYEIDRAQFERYRADANTALEFVERCRQRQEDARLLVKPGTSRGSAA